MRGSIVKRGTGYSIVYRAPDPKTGRTRQVWKGGFALKKEAEAALKRVVADIDGGTYAPPTDLTVRAFIEGTWLPRLEASDLRPSTVAMYRRSAERCLLPRLGGVKLADLRPLALTKWLDALAADGVGERTREIAGITAHKVLKAALDLELIPRNPADNAAVREARPRAKAPVPTIWTAEQLRAFLEHERDERLFALWRLAAMTGLRRGELAGLRWSDVDFEGGSLRVASTRVVVDYAVVESTPKTEKSRRTIGLDPTTVAVLRQHRARQLEERLRAGAAWEDSGLVFVDELGRPYHPQRFTQMLAARARGAGFPVVKLHALRHGHATAAQMSGIAPDASFDMLRDRCASRKTGFAAVAMVG